ncbi:carcinoembryonic antigen-related cell adhesion molecule 6-like [Gracilinanus agilis]|uniref:carcinoembryonic antigen-related cell adhesion molecule 6-like n=1 Tax=Gracilinanus agilis TaxID=191870 RepID=UPI001CFEE2B3|nr:carcinoembryonic antigen-related cell adhesion molecule 6-like [Gracilinanus agilis]
MVPHSGQPRLWERSSEAPHSGGSSWKWLLITASVLSCWIQPTSAQGVTIVPNLPYGRVGGSIVLELLGYTDTPIWYVWYKKSSAEDPKENKITLYYYNRRRQIPDRIRQRVLHNGSLLIPDLILDDAGYYLVKILRKDYLEQSKAGVYVTVTEKLAKPEIVVNNSNIIENESLIFTCVTENMGANIRWFFNDQNLSLNERMNTLENNQILIIKGLKREDAGSYQCEAWNPAIANRSDAFTLTVNYGPENIRIPQSPESGDIEVQFNDSLTLECLALSYPPAQYEWHVNESSSPVHSGSSYTLMPASLEHSGKYTCWARNRVTKLSVSKDITIKVAASKSPGGSNGATLSGGAITGIVIGVLAGVALLGALIYVLITKNTGGGKKDHPQERQSAPRRGK